MPSSKFDIFIYKLLLKKWPLFSLRLTKETILGYVKSVNHVRLFLLPCYYFVRELVALRKFTDYGSDSQPFPSRSPLIVTLKDLGP